MDFLYVCTKEKCEGGDYSKKGKYHQCDHFLMKTTRRHHFYQYGANPKVTYTSHRMSATFKVDSLCKLPVEEGFFKIQLNLEDLKNSTYLV